jgi:hypothetical protein
MIASSAVSTASFFFLSLFCLFLIWLRLSFGLTAGACSMRKGVHAWDPDME